MGENHQGQKHFARIPFELLDDPAVGSAYMIAVYAVLRRYADFMTGENAHPSLQTIANKIGCSRITVQRSIKRLERAGWIVVKRGQGRGNFSIYRVAERKGICKTPFRPEKVSHVSRKGICGSPYLETKTERQGGEPPGEDEFPE